MSFWLCAASGTKSCGDNTKSARDMYSTRASSGQCQYRGTGSGAGLVLSPVEQLANSKCCAGSVLYYFVDWYMRIEDEARHIDCISRPHSCVL